MKNWKENSSARLTVLKPYQVMIALQELRLQLYSTDPTESHSALDR